MLRSWEGEAKCCEGAEEEASAWETAAGGVAIEAAARPAEEAVTEEEGAAEAVRPVLGWDAARPLKGAAAAAAGLAAWGEARGEGRGGVEALVGRACSGTSRWTLTWPER